MKITRMMPFLFISLFNIAYGQMLTSDKAEILLNQQNIPSYTVHNKSESTDSLLFESIISSQLVKFPDIVNNLKNKGVTPTGGGEGYVILNSSPLAVQSYLMSLLPGSIEDHYGLKGTEDGTVDIVNHYGRINGFVIPKENGYNFSTPELTDSTQLSYIFNITKKEDILKGTIEYMPFGYKSLLQQIIAHPSIAKQIDIQKFTKQDVLISFEMQRNQTLLIQLPNKNNSSRFLILSSL